MRIAGFVLGAEGAAGLIEGAVAGGLAIHYKNSAGCNASGVCASGPLANAKHAALASNVGLFVGGVLLASGVALAVVGTMRAAPAVGPNGGGLVVGGAF